MIAERTAGCSCGALQVRCKGDPMRISLCHCVACRRRTGSAFSFNVTFDEAQVEPSGESSVFRRQAESGRWCTFHFCPTCGATVFYAIEIRPGRITVPAGAFAEPNAFQPLASVYNAQRERWLAFDPQCPIVEES